MYDGRIEYPTEPVDQTATAPFATMLARDDWPVLVGLPAVAAVFVFAVPTLGWWALAMAVIVYAAGFVAFGRARAAHDARNELATTLGCLPEIEGVVRPGHAARTAQLAEEMACALDLGPEDIAVVEAAARTRSVGWVGRDEPPNTRLGYDHRAAARWAGAIVARVGGFERVEAVVAPATSGEPDRIGIMRAIVETAASYDDATEGMGMGPEDAVTLLEDHAGGPGAHVTDALRTSLGMTKPS